MIGCHFISTIVTLANTNPNVLTLCGCNFLCCRLLLRRRVSYFRLGCESPPSNACGVKELLYLFACWTIYLRASFRAKLFVISYTLGSFRCNKFDALILFYSSILCVLATDPGTSIFKHMIQSILTGLISSDGIRAMCWL